MKSLFKKTAFVRILAGLVLALIVALSLPLTGLAQGTGTAAPAATSVSPAGYTLPETGWGVVSADRFTTGKGIGRRANGDFIIASTGGGVRIVTKAGIFARVFALPQEGDTIINDTLVSDNGEWATAVVGRPGSLNFAVAWDLTVPDDANGKVPVYRVLEKGQPRGVKIVQGKPCVFGNYAEGNGKSFFWNPVTGELVLTDAEAPNQDPKDINPEGLWVGLTAHPKAILGVGNKFDYLPTPGEGGATAFAISRSGKRIAGQRGVVHEGVVWEEGAPKLITHSNGTAPKGGVVGVTDNLVVAGLLNYVGYIHEKETGFALSLPDYLVKYGISTVAGERIVGFLVDEENRRFLLTSRRILQIGFEPVASVVVAPTKIQFTGDGVSVTWQGVGKLYQSTNLVDWNEVLDGINSSGGTSTFRSTLENTLEFYQVVRP